MTNLTQVAYLTRKIIRYFFTFLLIFFSLKIVGGALYRSWRARHPLPPPPLPPPAFGKLPPLNFGKEAKKPAKDFVLQTIDGNLPSLPPTAKVYFVIDKEHKFLALEKTEKIAQNLGFSLPPQKVAEDLYRYRNPTRRLTLAINPLTKTFRLQYPYLSDQTLATFRLTSQQQVISVAQNFLAKLERDHDDLVPEKIRITLLRFEGHRLRQALSLSEANLAQVDFFRQDIEDKYPIYPQNLKRANVSLLVSGDTEGSRQIVEAYYTYFPINRDKFAVYPLKPVAQAWEELKAKNYHLARWNSVETPTIPIRRIYLAYFDPHYPTNFLQPIYVFEGDGDFLGFVPAVSIEWVGE